jgi:aminopeptidase N
MRFLKPWLLSVFLSLSCFSIYAQEEGNIVMDELEIVGEINSKKPWPKGSAPRLTDVVHVRLNLNFNLEEATMDGEAELYCTPYFKPIDTVELDAQNFDIYKVGIWDKAVWKDLEYDYDGRKLKIALENTKSKEDTFKLFVAYKANPEKVMAEGGSAISDAKGLYFINRKNEDDGFMPQFWTQGEPESNSGWFPVVDKPNEKITHEIAMTVDSSWTTLSNGSIEFTTANGDGTRTDYWSMNQPHAPYLVMMAAGDFHTTTEMWDSIPVNYLVEKEWASEVPRIFGKTPEMLTFYSDVLNVRYPWNKYDQIVVREYVSGAMENTTAVIHGDFLYTDEKAYNDNSHEDVVAHEMFHHWFGDYVTCESWGQLPLNESFATYGEYLWIEHKYGKEEADWHLHQDLMNYQAEFNYGHRPDMIRYDLKAPLEMFDSHSYAKGARILHMLRNYLGDEAFFAGLKKYLETNAYGSAEIHDLRMAFEEVCGQDLNWFFNQWFLDNGHPVLEISYNYNKENYTQSVTVKQVQDIIEYPLYILPVKIAVHTKKGTKEYDIVINQQEQTFTFDVPSIQPSWVSFDADKMLLCEKDDQRSDAFLLSQIAKSDLMLDRREAVIAISKTTNSNLRSTIAGIAMKDKSPYVRIEGINMLSELNESGLNKVLKDVKRLAEKDSVFPVRASAISALAETYKLNEKKIFESGWEAMSYEVNSEALLAIALFNRDRSLELARSTLANNSRNEMNLSCWHVLAKNGNEQDLTVLKESIMSSDTQWRNYGLIFLGRYGLYHPAALSNKSIDVLSEIYAQFPPLQERCTYVFNYMKDVWSEQLVTSEDKALKKDLQSRLSYLDQTVSSL